MGMKFHTDVMGDVTTNVGIITYDKEKVANLVSIYVILKASNLKLL